jgi:S-adenosylmethionine synthetase
MYSVESVTEGHPDKVADQISDRVLDAILEVDSNARVACETMVLKDRIIIAGEFSFIGKVNLEQAVRSKIEEIGYIYPEDSFNSNTKIEFLMNQQSPEISNSVISNNKIGAGDQGNMFGYATNETSNYMPYAINLVNSLAKELTNLRKSTLKYLKPDGKSQVTFIDNEVDSITISAHHSRNVDIDILRRDISELLVNKLVNRYNKKYINPSNSFILGGPEADVGLTGRKIIIDAYGPFCKHGGGAFSGKDPTKVDRSGAYAARWIAKNLVASSLVDKCEVQLSYVIGVEEPVSINVDNLGTSFISNEELSKIVSKVFDLRPKSIIDRLNLRRPIYSKIAAYGHFGIESLPWENLDMINEILKA